MTLGMILERGELLDRLSHNLAGAAAGSGSVAFVYGEAGAGKSTVVDALARTAPRNTLVLYGFCDPLSTPRPLGPLIDIANDPDSGLDEVLEHSDLFEMFVAVLARLQHTIRPILMVVEDVHWADAATLDLLTFLGRRIGDTKTLLVATYRGDEITPDHPLRPILADLGVKPHVHRYPVEPLSLVAVETLAAGEDVDSQHIFDVTGGNAFYVTELLVAEGTIPETVQDAVLARVSLLDAEARQAVEAVSVAPRSMELAQIVSLTGVDPAAPERAVHRGVLTGDSSGYRFRHELARLAIEQSIPQPRRAALHATVLQQIADGGDLSRLAHHAIKSDNQDAILRHVPAAAREATRRSAHHQAVGLYEAAHPFAKAMDPEDQFSFLVGYTESLRLINRTADSLAVANELVEFAEANEVARFLGVALRIRGKAVWMGGDAAASNADMEKSVAVLDALRPSPDLADSLDWAASNHMLDRHYASGMRLAERAVEVAGAIGSATHEVKSLQTMGTIELVTGDATRGIMLIEKSIELGRSSSDRRVGLVGYEMLGTGGGEVRIYNRALDWLDQSITVGREMDEDYLVAYSIAWKARIKCEQGYWDEAIELAGSVASGGTRSARIVPVTALGTIGRVRVRRGDPGGVLVLTQAIELGRHGTLQHIWAPVSALSEWHWLQGENHRALDVLREFSERVFETDSAWGKGEVALWMWMAGGLDEIPAGAAEPFALMINGNWTQAAQEWEEIGCPYEQALALSLGDTDAKRSALGIFDRLGARPAGQWLRRILRDQGITSIPAGPRRSTKNHPAGLTPRQAEVMGLLQLGLSNAEIASRLYISLKTAEHHVSAVLSKLGVTSRSEVAAMRGTLHSEAD